MAATKHNHQHIAYFRKSGKARVIIIVEQQSGAEHT